jgi:predicted O-methyltransferase YrrM
MKIISKTINSACDCLVDMSPRLFLDSLRRKHYDFVAREFNRAYRYDWSKFKMPSQPQGFEDLVQLFDLSPINRGIIRQDFDEAAALFRIIRSMPNARGVEIGRFNGGSTLMLAVAVGPGGKITSIDIEPQDDAKLKEILKQAQVSDRVELIIGDANKIEVKQPLDFVFIDGDHSYEGAKKDHNRWGNLVRPGGYIIHHDMGNSRDFSTQWNELARLHKDIVTKQSKEVEVVTEAGSMSIFRRRNASWTAI